MNKLSFDREIKIPGPINIDKDYGAIILLFLGTCLFIWGIKYLLDNIDFLSTTVETTAVVTDINAYYGSGGRPHDIYTTTFQYEANGIIYTDETKCTDSKPDWEEGSTIEIYYNPDNPCSASVYSKKDLLDAGFFRLGFGVFLLAIGSLILVLHIRSRRQNNFK